MQLTICTETHVSVSVIMLAADWCSHLLVASE